MGKFYGGCLRKNESNKRRIKNQKLFIPTWSKVCSSEAGILMSN